MGYNLLRCTNKLRGTNEPCDYFKPTTMPIRKVDKTFVVKYVVNGSNKAI